MKKAKLTSVIALVTLAMIGLIAVQLYWIHNAITLKEQQFDMAVNDALGNVVVDLEKQEALNMVKGFGFETKLFNKLNRLDERIDYGGPTQIFVRLGGPLLPTQPDEELPHTRPRDG